MEREELERRTAEVNAVIERYLPEESGYQKTIFEAMNYSVRAGGKRLRPMLMQETYRLFAGAKAAAGDSGTAGGAPGRNGGVVPCSGTVLTGDGAPGGNASFQEGRDTASGEAIVEPFMAAIEMIHTSSLIHDDLPCMDNDTLRRGVPTTWVKYGYDMAVLAGDALLIYAVETAAKAFEAASRADQSNYLRVGAGCDTVLPSGADQGSPSCVGAGCDAVSPSGADQESPSRVGEDRGAVLPSCVSRVGRAIGILAGKTGIYGMIGGQVVDVELTGKPIPREKLDFIYRLKTGALLEASMMIGAVLAGAPEEAIGVVEEMASCIGLAFQIQDDILDVTGTPEQLGKPTLSDEKNKKTTYVTLEGIEKAKADVAAISERAVALLHRLPGRNPFLENLIRMLVTRES